MDLRRSIRWCEEVRVSRGARPVLFWPTGRGKATIDPKRAAQERFGNALNGLIELSHRIHAHPEIGLEEEKASLSLCEALPVAKVASELGLTVIGISRNSRSIA
jgi:hypothetical protein